MTYMVLINQPIKIWLITKTSNLHLYLSCLRHIILSLHQVASVYIKMNCSKKRRSKYLSRNDTLVENETGCVRINLRQEQRNGDY